MMLKNIIHSVASICFLIWLVGFFRYGMNGHFHFFIIIAVAAALGRFFMEKQVYKKNK